MTYGKKRIQGLRKLFTQAPFSVVILLLLSFDGRAQSISPDLQRMAEHIERAISENHPDWKMQRIEPILKTENVIIDQWHFEDSGVRMSFVPFKNANDAKEAIEHFRKYMKCKEETSDLGDEGCWFGGTGTELAFRRGRITVYISSAVQISLDPEVDKMMDPKDSIAEMKKLSKEVGQHAARAIDAP